jgi:hypothetical protein
MSMDASVLDDGDPIAQAFSFFHQMCSDKNRFPRSRMPRTNSQIALLACGSRDRVVSSSRKTTSGSLIRSEDNEQPLLLTTR